MIDAFAPVHSHLQQRVDALAADNDALSALLSTIDIPTVLLDTELRITRFTDAAARVLSLQATDKGRPLAEIASKVIDSDLSRYAKAALDHLTPLEKTVVALDGKRYLLRGIPHRVLDEAPQGVVLTLVDITTQKPTDESLRAASERVAEDLRRMTRLLALGEQLLGLGDTRALLDRVVRAASEIASAPIATIQLRDRDDALTLAAQVGIPPSSVDFFEQFDPWEVFPPATLSDRQRRVSVTDVTSNPGALDAATERALSSAGVRGLQATPLFDRGGRFLGMLSTYHRTRHAFDDAEVRWFDLLAHLAVEMLERRRTEDLWTSTANHLQRRVTERTTWLVLMQDLTRVINASRGGHEALRLVAHRICETGYWQLAYVYLADREDAELIVPAMSWTARERLRPFQLASPQRRDRGGIPLAGRVFADAMPAWVNGEASLLAAMPSRAEAATSAGMKAAVALPIKSGGEVLAVLELFSEQEDAPNQALADVMADMSVPIARAMQSEIATTRILDFVHREQQSLLQTLHDSLGQTLTGLGMLSAGLRERLLPIDAGMATTAAQIAEQARMALEHVRRISRGLVPFDIEPDGLMRALRDLALTTGSLHDIRVSVEGDIRSAISSTRVATEIYQIAQEAVTNALKHAHATTITIDVRERAGLITMAVADDGIGIQDGVLKEGGFGLRIMQERATSIGALMSIAPGRLGGTVVTCLLRPALLARAEAQP